MELRVSYGAVSVTRVGNLMLTWEKLMKAWATAINERKPDALLPLLADDFHWVTSFRHAPIGARLEDMESFILDAPLEAFEYESTIHNGEDTIIGTHLITWDGVPQKVMAAAILKDGKVSKYHHMIKPA